MKNLFFIPVLLLLCAGIYSCKDDKFTSDASHKLIFSTDTVSFDTVFTGLVTPVKRIMVYNNTSENIRIENIHLFSERNCFQVNVSGKSGSSFQDVELRSKDSLYVFVQVMINELGQDAPLHILDSLRFQYNGNRQNIMLRTYGQDVHLLRKQTITEDTHWTSNKPYLIYDTLKVEENATLKIDAGAKIYFHNQGILFVKGTLEVLGEGLNPVLFRGDRMDNLFDDLPYDNLSGQWEGIRFSKESSRNRISGAFIRNGIFGIQIDSAEMDPDVYRLVLSNSQIHNTKKTAFKATNANVYAYNTVFSNGTYSCVLLEGGKYLFNHCTIAGYTKESRTNSALMLSNRIQFTTEPAIPLNAEFNNCIVYGTLAQELKADNINENNGSTDNDFRYKFNSCLIRYETTNSSGIDTNSEAFQHVIWNKEPAFTISNDLYIYNYHLNMSSAAIGEGDPEILILYPECQTDKEGTSRHTIPDMGAYEWVRIEI